MKIRVRGGFGKESYFVKFLVIFIATDLIDPFKESFFDLGF